MRRRDFQRLVESLPKLSPQQLRQLGDSVSELSRGNAVKELVARQVLQCGRCPHCSDERIQRWGKTASGEQRYRCTSCSRSFTGLTGTVLNRLRDKSRLLEYTECMRQGLSVRKTALRLDMHATRVFAWRHRLMPQLAAHQPSSLPGVAEVDETFFRKSYKGQRVGLPRPAHKRGTPASKRGISSEQVPVLTAVSRGSRRSHLTVLPGVPKAVDVVAALKPAVERDSVLCADTAGVYKAAGATLGVTLRLIPSGSRKLGPYHIQNVNALHQRIKDWFRPFRGVATKNLASYLAWFRFFDEAPGAKTSTDLLRDTLSRTARPGPVPL
ncbi:conserved hypothetical protein [mine drainage metagenome]|uniref:Transposase of ISCARN43, IS1595 family ISPna2 group n=1 Tax=mine drainage metagenome TaxID=410659 RepID=E6PTB1_9ZZZZ